MPVADRPNMSDYGVPADEDGLLPWSWAEERLVGTRNYWLTTVSGAGRPHSMPVWGVWLPDAEQFWFSCAPSARKTRNLAANARVVVAPTDTVEVVSVEGRAAPSTEAEIDHGIDRYFAKYGEEMGMERGSVAEFLTTNAAYTVTPERAFGMIERPEDFGPRATRWRW